MEHPNAGTPGKRTLTEGLPTFASIQAKTAGRGMVVDGPVDGVSDGNGKAMPRDVQEKMEASFGADFSAVRVHEGARSEALGARAFTQGADIHFAPGEYQPASLAGQELLGHELAHVVQQRQGRVQATTQAKGVGINDDAGLEREADEMGSRASRGEQASTEAGGVAQHSVVQRKIGDDTDLDPARDEDIDDGVEADEAEEEDGGAVSSPLVAGKPPGAVQMKRAGQPQPTATAARRRRTIQQATTMYAPLVFLAPGEENGPSDASEFIRNSRLRWSNAGLFARDHREAGEGEVNERRLGSGGYEHDGHDSNDDVRPKDDKGDGGDEGFFLDLNNGDRQRLGSNRNPPVYHEAVDGRFITYWFFYAYNKGPAPIVADNHEGDWERIVVKLDRRNRATHVAYYQHNGAPEVKPWKSVPRQGTHPLVYSAKGSHASYSKPGDHGLVPGVKDTAGRGRQWRTWNNMKNARAQGWYGYGGAWGEVGNIKDTTGPQGPSRYKPPAPKGW